MKNTGPNKLRERAHSGIRTSEKKRIKGVLVALWEILQQCVTTLFPNPTLRK